LIVAERTDPSAGLRLLYVALTRPTQHLAILHSSPLPASLKLRDSMGENRPNVR
jgi:ATP-dependent exoDNAse (exonuclease V) beta subunit